MDSRTLIDAQFDRAVEIIQNLPKTGPIQTGYEEKLTMYSLYKQATVGNVKSPRPGMWDMLGRAKWDAWAKHKDLDSYDAKWRYVDALLKVLRKYSDKTMARDLVRELESFGGDPANLVHSMALSRSLDSDSSSSDGHATGSGYRSAHLSSYAQGNPDVQDEDGTSEEETSDEEEIGPIAPPLVEQNTVSDRPQSSFSSHRYRTPVASATLGPTPVIPASQPQPGFETPSAFAGPSSASLSSYPPQYAEQAITQDLVSPPSQSIYRRPPSARPHALSAAGFPPRPSSQLALERAIESVQAQLAALSERMEIIESHSFASRPFASPGASRSSSAFAGRRSPSEQRDINIDELGLWSIIFKSLARVLVSLRQFAVFLSHSEGRSPTYLVVRRLFLDISFILCVLGIIKTVWRRTGIRRREINTAFRALWLAIMGKTPPRAMADRGV
ncbi:acyl CoA binding protein-domain-containing protein [Gloeopeniophorella convolvens]|nr:acyl CoA binding protein-domain-containing protein [Gloeopeniophorella convolvens]